MEEKVAVLKYLKLKEKNEYNDLEIELLSLEDVDVNLEKEQLKSLVEHLSKRFLELLDVYDSSPTTWESYRNKFSEDYETFAFVLGWSFEGWLGISPMEAGRLRTMPELESEIHNLLIETDALFHTLDTLTLMIEGTRKKLKAYESSILDLQKGFSEFSKDVTEREAKKAELNKRKSSLIQIARARERHVKQVFGNRANRNKLITLIASRFDKEELEDLCYDLEFPYEDFETTAPSRVSRKMISHARKHMCEWELILELQKTRPNEDWLNEKK